MAWLFPADQLTHMLQAASDFLELLVDFAQMVATVGSVVIICFIMAWIFPCKGDE